MKTSLALLVLLVIGPATPAPGLAAEPDTAITSIETDPGADNGSGTVVLSSRCACPAQDVVAPSGFIAHTFTSNECGSCSQAQLADDPDNCFDKTCEGIVTESVDGAGTVRRPFSYNCVIITDSFASTGD